MLLDDYGVPFLQSAVNRRFERAAAAAERRAAGVTISLHLPVHIIDQMVAGGLVGGAGRDDPERLVRAAQAAISGWLARPPEPVAAMTDEEFQNLSARIADRNRRLEPVLVVPGFDPRVLGGGR